jgi:adenine/guanine phosphoribosyltransferase-like PRPP-binding protein
LEQELHLIVEVGLADAFPRITSLREFDFYRQRRKADTAGAGTPELRRMLLQAIAAWEIQPDADAVRDLLAVDLAGRHQRALNGKHGLRERAGAHFDVGWNQFSREYEKPLLRRFAEWLEIWGSSAEVTLRNEHVERLDFEDLRRVAERLHRDIDRDFRPDVVVTMSGPGSFAACYTMKLDASDVPVVMAVTFPVSPSPRPNEARFQLAAAELGWRHVVTSKWSVYLPDVVFAYPAGARVLLLDDRVMTGDTQVQVSALLRAGGYEVQCAALFVPAGSSAELQFRGRVVRGPFEMPWGSDRGRS